MTAYFSLIIECSKKHLEHDFMLNFYSLLAENGLVFSGGVTEDTAHLSINEIAEKNQYYLENEAKYAAEDNFVWELLQVNSQYLEFSETRIIIFDIVTNDFITAEIIIPEDELAEGDFDKISWDRAKVEPILHLASEIWKQPYVNSIQTELEISKGFNSVAEIAKGKEPSIEPFAILPENIISNRIDELLVFGRTERNGIILLNWNADYFVWNMLPAEWKRR